MAAVVGEPHRASAGQRLQVGELLSRQPFGAGRELQNPDPAPRLVVALTAPELLQAVHRRGQVGHPADGAEATRCRGRGGPGDPLLPGLAGFAEMAVEVDERRRHHRTLPAEQGGARGQLQLGAHLLEDPILQEQVAALEVDPVEGVE